MILLIDGTYDCSDITKIITVLKYYKIIRIKYKNKLLYCSNIYKLKCNSAIY